MSEDSKPKVDGWVVDYGVKESSPQVVYNRGEVKVPTYGQPFKFIKEGDIKKTSEMVHPLKEPEGWFLLRMEHQHTRIIYRDDEHKPDTSHPDGPWFVQFQKLPYGGMARSGRGNTMKEAWAKALEAVSNEPGR